MAWFAADDRPGPTERVVNGYTLFDLGGGVSFGRHLEVRALGRNLFDRTYFASQDVRAIYAAGAQGGDGRGALLGRVGSRSADVALPT